MRATLTYLEPRTVLTPPTELAPLGADDLDFMARHVEALRDESAAADSLLSRFQAGSDVPGLFDQLTGGSPERFVEISATLVTRLQRSMDQATNPNPGVVAILATEAEAPGPAISVLKLDAVGEAAQLIRRAGRVELRVLKHLLPGPGNLQKGISWPDERTTSDATVIDRNVRAALYFFNAFQLRVSASPVQAERALSRLVVAQVPGPRRSEAIELINSQPGPAEEVIERLRGSFPAIQHDAPELGFGDHLGGFVRAGRVARRTRFLADGIEVVVPQDRIDRVRVQPEGGGYVMTIRFDNRPEETPG